MALRRPAAGGKWRCGGLSWLWVWSGKGRFGLQDFMNVNCDCGAAQVTGHTSWFEMVNTKQKKKIRISLSLFLPQFYLCYISRYFILMLALSSRYTNCQFNKNTDCQRRTKLIFSIVDVETTLICTDSFHVSLFGDSRCHI
jgi:hypothetical protein